LKIQYRDSYYNKDFVFAPHSLRRTHTSLLAEAGVSLPEIMERLGHVNDDTTTQVFARNKNRKKKPLKSKECGQLNI